MPEINITKDEFKRMDQDDRQWLMLTTWTDHYKDHEERICKLEKRKHFDSAQSGFFGLIGGATVWIVKMIFGKGA